MSKIEEEHAIWISGRIHTLLSHYFDRGEAKEVSAAAMTDWIYALARHEKPIIDRACRDYVVTGGRARPVPNDILSRCNRFSPSTPGYLAIEPPNYGRDEPAISPELREKFLDDVLMKNGMQREKHGVKWIDEATGEAERKPHWSEKKNVDPRVVAALKKARSQNALIAGVPLDGGNIR